MPRLLLIGEVQVSTPCHPGEIKNLGTGYAPRAKAGPSCHPGIPRKDGGDEGDRTPDPDAASVVLSQLSYVPKGIRLVGKIEMFASGIPKGIRTPVAAVKGRSPRPTRRWGRKKVNLYFMMNQEFVNLKFD